MCLLALIGKQEDLIMLEYLYMEESKDQVDDPHIKVAVTAVLSPPPQTHTAVDGVVASSSTLDMAALNSSM